jgi:hypothetical protein
MEGRVNDDFECLLQLSCARAEKLATALDRNWTIHLILAGLGLAIVFDVGSLPEFLVKHFVDQDKFERRPVAALLLPLVLFYFMKFGHLLTSFFSARDLVEFSIKKYAGSLTVHGPLSSLRETTSFFEAFYRGGTPAKTKTLKFAAFCITVVVFSAEQATALYLLIQTYGRNFWSISAITVSGIALLILYASFWNPPVIHKTAGRSATLLSIIFVVAGFLLLGHFKPA